MAATAGANFMNYGRRLLVPASCLALVGLAALCRSRPPRYALRHSRGATAEASSLARACCMRTDENGEPRQCSERTHASWCAEMCSQPANAIPAACQRLSSSSPSWSPAPRTGTIGKGAPPGEPSHLQHQLHSSRTRTRVHAHEVRGSALPPSNSPSPLSPPQPSAPSAAKCPQRGGMSRELVSEQSGCPAEDRPTATKPVHRLSGSGVHASCWMVCADPNAPSALTSLGPQGWDEIVHYEDGCCPEVYTKAVGYAQINQFNRGHSVGSRRAVKFVPDLLVGLYDPPLDPDGDDSHHVRRPYWMLSNDALVHVNESPRHRDSSQGGDHPVDGERRRRDTRSRRR